MNEHVRKCLCSVVPKLDSKPFLSKRSQRDDMCEHVREVESPSHVCGGCGGSLRLMECFHASVLFPDGWQVVRHRAKRCYNKTCTWHKNRVFYNFVAMSKTRHDFFWHPESGVLSYFFVCCSWGVTTSWLRQMSRRLVRLGAVIKFALGTSDVSTCFQKSPKKSMTCKALEKSQVRKGKEVEEQSTVEL